MTAQQASARQATYCFYWLLHRTLVGGCCVQDVWPSFACLLSRSTLHNKAAVQRMPSQDVHVFRMPLHCHVGHGRRMPVTPSDRIVVAAGCMIMLCVSVHSQHLAARGLGYRFCLQFQESITLVRYSSATPPTLGACPCTATCSHFVVKSRSVHALDRNIDKPKRLCLYSRRGVRYAPVRCIGGGMHTHSWAVRVHSWCPHLGRGSSGGLQSGQGRM